jgi:hypothetical protein
MEEIQKHIGDERGDGLSTDFYVEYFKLLKTI